MKRCIICGAKLDCAPLLNLPDAPAYAQDLPGEKDLENERGIELNLFQCPVCGLIQFDCEPVEYYRDVIRGGGFSETLQKLRREQYKHLIETYRLENKKIIEIGCGEGEFVLPLTDFPVQAFGIENREALVRKAKVRGLNVWKAFPETPETIIDNGPFDAFLMFNFLEHQPRPNDMLRCIYNNLTEDGIGLVTVPSFEYMFSRAAFYELVRDHLAYYTMDSFQFLMNYNGFEIVEQEIVNGNTLSVVVRKRKQINLTAFSDSLALLKQKLMDFVKEKSEQGKKIALWGASHEAFLILSVTGLSRHVEYIIDSAPFKQGKYSPASHLPIVGPESFSENPVECIIIVAPEYAAEIARVAREKFGEAIEICSLEGSELRRK